MPGLLTGFSSQDPSRARCSRRALWGIATLLVISIASTPWAAGAQDVMQDHGYSEEAYRQLQASHLVRTLSITLAAVWALVEAWRLPKVNAPDSNDPSLAAHPRPVSDS